MHPQAVVFRNKGVPLLFTLISLCFLGFTGTATAAEATSDKLASVTAFDIPSMPLSQALKTLADQAGIQILFEERVVQGHDAPAVKTHQSALQALSMLLSNTDLEFTAKNETIAVRKKTTLATVSQNDNGKGLQVEGASNPPLHVRGGGQGVRALEEGSSKSSWFTRLARAATGSSAESPSENSPDSSKDETRTRNVEEVLSEIIVSARKMEETLQRVPVSVAAVTGEELEKRSIQNLSELGQSTPNFNFGSAGQTGRNAGVLYIRGVGPNTGAATVGVYIDGVYLGQGRGNDLETVDLERVEVLRGPQGTLFGKNTSGGAVNIITRKPDISADALSGRAQITTGSRNRLDFLGSIDAPLITDRLALQISGSRRTQDGYAHRADGEVLGDLDRVSSRFALQWQPTDQFSALLSGDVLSYEEGSAPEKLLAVNTTTSQAVIFTNLISPTPFDDRWVPSTDFFSYATGANASRGDIWGTSLTLNYDVDWAAFKSISSYRTLKTRSEQDADNSPVQILDFFIRDKQHQFSQEFQLVNANAADRLSWTLGAYYFREVLKGGYQDAYVVTALAEAFFGNPYQYPFSFGNSADTVNTSYAVYGQSNFNLTDKLRATLGARLTRDDVRTVAYSWEVPSHINQTPLDPKRQHWDDVSPRLGLDYQWTPDIMTYVSATRGFKAGGFTNRNDVGTPSFKSEHLRTYELGLRSELFARRLRFNVTGFYNDYKDLQMAIGGSTTDGSGIITPFSITANIPGVRIVGAEVELSAIPVAGLTLTGGLGITDVKYTELPDDPRWSETNLVSPDNDFPYTPKVSYTLGAEYSTSLMEAFNLTARVDYAHKSDIAHNLENTPLLRQRAYGLLNARLTLESESSGLSLSVFGTNLTDEHYFTGGYDDGTIANSAGGLGITIVNMAPPREYGVSVQWRF